MRFRTLAEPTGRRLYGRSTTGRIGIHWMKEITRPPRSVASVRYGVLLSCLILAAQADHCAIETIEGLHKGSELHPLQTAFVSEAAVQCGYCTPGMIMAAKPLIEKDPEAAEATIRQHLSNNLCRCTGYDQPVKAVLKAAKEIKGETNA